MRVAGANAGIGDSARFSEEAVQFSLYKYLGLRCSTSLMAIGYRRSWFQGLLISSFVFVGLRR